MNEYARAIAAALKHIGGAYRNRDHVSDPNGRLPFESVPIVKQREALDFMVARVDRRADEVHLDRIMGSDVAQHVGDATRIATVVSRPDVTAPGATGRSHTGRCALGRAHAAERSQSAARRRVGCWHGD